jgi:DHA2 family multidrug resistance protein
MLIFGAVLFGTTALLPLLMQTLLGYTAMQSGMALSPGGMVIAVLMPIVGWMVTRVDARWMIIAGIVVVAWSLHQMAGFSLDIDFRTIVVARMVQGFGLAFIFVPINTIAYANVAAGARNNASSLMSIARNIGGSVGIAYTSAMVSRTAQANQSLLVGHLTPYDPQYAAAIAALQRHFTEVMGDPSRAKTMAAAALAAAVNAQAHVLAYLNQFAWLAVAFLALVPVVLLMKRRKAGHVELAIE